MLLTHLPNDNPFRTAHQAVLNNQPIPAVTAAQLEAIGVDVGALETRIKQTAEFRR